MPSMSKKMYKDTPTIGKDEETGKPAVKRGRMKGDMSEREKKASEVNSGTEGMMKHEEGEVHARHSMDRHMMHAKHEHEHALHKGGSKHEMHARHEKEMKDMHKRHEKELEHEDPGEGEKEINKVEKE